MKLKDNYKNDKYSGKRKYQLIQNDDETVSLDDVTEYLESGDIFNADDVNAANAQINKNSQSISDLDTGVKEVKRIREVTIPETGWSATSPYTMTVAISGIKAGSPIIAQKLIGTLNETTVNTQKEAWNCVDRIDVQDGKIVLYCYGQKPKSQFGIAIKGV